MVNQALKKHQILTMKKVEEKKAATAAHRELASQALPDDQMNIDSGQEVFFYPFIFISLDCPRAGLENLGPALPSRAKGQMAGKGQSRAGPGPALALKV